MGRYLERHSSCMELRSSHSHPGIGSNCHRSQRSTSSYGGGPRSTARSRCKQTANCRRGRWHSSEGCAKAGCRCCSKCAWLCCECELAACPGRGRSCPARMHSEEEEGAPRVGDGCAQATWLGRSERRFHGVHVTEHTLTLRPPPFGHFFFSTLSPLLGARLGSPSSVLMELPGRCRPPRGLGASATPAATRPRTASSRWHGTTASAAGCCSTPATEWRALAALRPVSVLSAAGLALSPASAMRGTINNCGGSTGRGSALRGAEGSGRT